MAHPQMFDDDDPLLVRVRSLALAWPGAQEKISHGHPAFFTQKVFGYYGGSVKVDGVWVQHPQSLLIHPAPDEHEALSQDPRCYRPGYLGASGWLGLQLDAATDWAEVAELLQDSYRQTAPAHLVAQLDAQENGGSA